MTGLEYVLIGAVLVVLVTSVVMVIRRRRAELVAEREAAHSLQRMARALQELQSELGGQRGQAGAAADDSEHVRIQIVEGKPSAADSELERAVQDHEVLQLRLMLDASTPLHSRPANSSGAQRLALEWTRTAAQRMLVATQEAGSVVGFWEHLTRDANHGPSYSDVMGPMLGDYLIHAANVGVVDREQADVLQEWAESTQAVIRAPRGGKRPVSGDVADHIYLLGSEREAVG